MKDFYEKEDYTFDDILSLIENEVEESIYLDFKESRSLDKSDFKKKDISKDVASFANSDGGIIVYGITEEKHKASKLSFVDGNIYTKEWLEQIINSSIQRRIPDLKIYPIRKDGNIEESIYIVKIPKSFEAPHLSKDKKFYKRFNFESVPMEEYEIRQSYGQKLKSKLLIHGWSFQRKDKEADPEEYFFECEIDIYNEGNVTESNYKVNIYFNNFNPYLNISWPRDIKNYDYTKMDNRRVKISATSKAPIYPGETLNGFRFNINIKKENILRALKDVDIEIKLFYENGENEMKTSLEKMTSTFKFENIEL